MGCAQSLGGIGPGTAVTPGVGGTIHDPAQKARSKQISKELIKDGNREAQIVKILLLGSGESGKSTIVKQMKLLHPVDDRPEAGFTEEEKADAIRAIYDNVVDSIVALLEAMEDFGLDLSSNKLNDDKFKVIRFASDHHGSGTRPPPDVVRAISNLWNSSTVQLCYQRRSEFQLNDSAGYFLADVERVCSPDFSPTDQDVLRTRVKTTGIVKIEFKYRQYTFHMFDVGGQRSERKKWIHCFDNVHAVLFIISLSEYDQVLFEDRTVNRMQESLELFSSVVNNIHFMLMPFIVFFNKLDLFEEKLKTKSIRQAFPDFTGDQTSVEETTDFIINKYLSQSKTTNKQRTIIPHLTTATDTKLVERIFTSVSDIILNEILKDVGLN